MDRFNCSVSVVQLQSYASIKILFYLQAKCFWLNYTLNQNIKFNG